MLFTLLLANMIILLCFFFLLLVIVFFTIPVQIENARLKLALINRTGDPITVVNNAIEMLIKRVLNTYQNSQKKQYIY